MHQIIDHSLSSIAVIVSGIFGSRVATITGSIVAEATQAPVPGWMVGLQGPFGALIGLALGLVWMSKRLTAAESKAEEKEKKADEKNDKREAERDADRKTLITVIEQNSQVLQEVKRHIDK